MITKWQWHAHSDDASSSSSAAGASASSKGRSKAGKGGASKGAGFWFEVVVTTYETLLLEERRLRAVPWSMLIFDEAHRLKNPESRTRTTVDGLRYEQVTLLTGTPVQNNAGELYSLLNLLDPRKFCDGEAFERRYGDATAGSDALSEELQKMLSPYMLRRLKCDVLKDEIPEKVETILPVELTAQQKSIYRALLEKNAAALAHAQQQTEGGGGRASGNGGGAAPALSNVFVKLRQLCNHPRLLEKADAPMPRLDNAYEVRKTLETMVGASGKLQLLQKLMPRLRAQGRKVLLFSQMKRMLDILEDFLSLSAMPYERLDVTAQRHRG